MRICFLSAPADGGGFASFVSNFELSAWADHAGSQAERPRDLIGRRLRQVGHFAAIGGLDEGLHRHAGDQLDLPSLAIPSAGIAIRALR